MITFDGGHVPDADFDMKAAIYWIRKLSQLSLFMVCEMPGVIKV